MTDKSAYCVEALLPCPFCGATPAFSPYKQNGLSLKCPTFGCISFNQRVLRHSIEWLRGKMVETWNERHPTGGQP